MIGELVREVAALWQRGESEQAQPGPSVSPAARDAGAWDGTGAVMPDPLRTEPREQTFQFELDPFGTWRAS